MEIISIQTINLSYVLRKYTKRHLNFTKSDHESDEYIIQRMEKCKHKGTCHNFVK